jgi:hypothetical protein
MSARKTVHVFALVLGVLACGRDQDAPPEDDTTTGAPSDSSGPEPSTTTPTTTTVGSDSTGVVDDSSGGSDSGTTGEGCMGPDGCYDCEPTQSEQLLNHCTDASCEPFPNTPERLPLIGRDGSLPAIP